jgi:hypothetical protein
MCTLMMRKSPTEDIPKPWKKKGALRKKPTEDEGLYHYCLPSSY